MAKYIKYLLLLILFCGIVFTILSPINKAKVFLNCVEIHPNNQEQLESTKDIILKNSFEKYDSLDAIPNIHHENLLHYYIAEDAFRWDTSGTPQLSFLYAKEGEHWNATDNIISGLPFYMFDHAYCSDSLMILVFHSGGFGMSTNFDFFEIVEDKYKLRHSVSIFGKDIFMLALSLRFDEGLYQSDSANRRNSLESK